MTSPLPPPEESVLAAAMPVAVASAGINRWQIAIMGTLLQVCLGTVYAWSFFQKPLVQTYGWSNTTVAWAFSLAICSLGLAAAFGGIKLSVYGPRKLAVTGACLYALGNILAGVALYFQSWPLLYLGYGVVGGVGLGLGYVTPVATAAKWFPDKKGLVTGMVVMGFGLGALVMSKLIAPNLMNAFNGNLVLVFIVIGVIMAVISVPAAAFMRNPPADFVAPGAKPAPVRNSATEIAPVTATHCLTSGKFIMMWLIFFFNITAGIMFIGFQSPMLQDLLKQADGTLDATALAAAGATLIAISSLFNGIGRFFWGGISDRIGRIQTFRLILGSQIAVFIGLMYVGNPWIFGILVCYVLLCYGGGFGSMPSFVMDVFGARLMPVVYGTILTAWAMAGIAGPQLVAYIKDNYAANASQYTFTAGSILLALGLIISFFVGNKRFSEAEHG